MRPWINFWYLCSNFQANQREVWENLENHVAAWKSYGNAYLKWIELVPLELFIFHFGY